MSPQPRILVVDDDELISSMISRALRAEGCEVRTEQRAAPVLRTARSWQPSVVLLDIRLPDRSGIELLGELIKAGVEAKVVMLTADDTAETAVKAMKLGAADYLTKPFNLDEVVIIVRNLVDRERLDREVHYLRKVAADRFERPFIGASPAVRRLLGEIDRVAGARVASILITGESGTGKELVARHLHQARHGAAPFMAVNCAALPEQLLESELFGHERGAFTDAMAQKKGVFELAHGGSILLDEIGEMDQRLQAKLLRVLEERTIRRVGGQEDIPIEVTVMATTNRDLAGASGDGEFRRDLYYRLNGFSLQVPPLRERREDIAVLAGHFLSLFTTRYNKKSLKRFSDEAARMMAAYDWPGNVRELRNVVERIVVLESGEAVLPSHLPPEWKPGPAAGGAAGAAGGVALPAGGLSLEELERELIRQALERTGRNKAKAAKLLGLTYDAFRYQVKKFGME